MNKFLPVEIPRALKFKNSYFETYSFKIKRNVKIFNELQYSNFLLLEFNSKVMEFCEYPVKEYLEIDGKYEETIITMYVKYQNGSEEMQLISYSDNVVENSNSIKRRTIKQEHWCAEKGFGFALITEKEINQGLFYLNNLRYLFGLLKRQDIPLIRRYLKILNSKIYNDKIKIGDLFKCEILPNDMIYSVVALGIYEGLLKASIFDKPICYDTEVWLNSDKKY